MISDLEDRFFKFLEQLSDSENIDSLPSKNQANENKKADYFLNNRTGIVEVKSLKTNTEPKVEQELNKHRRRPDFPVFYGRMDLNKLLLNLPDGENIKKSIYNKLTRSIENLFRSTNKQIESTQKTFKTSETINILVILNDIVDIFSPEVIVSKISEMFQKRNMDLTLRYPDIDCVWIIEETHFTTIKNQKAVPVIIVEGPNAEKKVGLGKFVENLQFEWAKFNHSPLFICSEKTITKLDFTTFTEHRKNTATKITRQESWRRSYLNNPYLRHYSDEDLLKYGKNLFDGVTPFFLKGGPKPKKEHFHKFGEKITHFIEEMNYRGLDWRKMNLPVNNQ